MRKGRARAVLSSDLSGDHQAANGPGIKNNIGTRVERREKPSDRLPPYLELASYRMLETLKGPFFTVSPKRCVQRADRALPERTTWHAHEGVVDGHSPLTGDAAGPYCSRHG